MDEEPGSRVSCAFLDMGFAQRIKRSDCPHKLVAVDVVILMTV
jgi:hypothetical protein